MARDTDRMGGRCKKGCKNQVNPLNAELNPICHLLALLGGATIVVVSRLRVYNCSPWHQFCGLSIHHSQ
jgi:hypothetical protein